MKTLNMIKRETQLRTVAGEMTFRRDPGDIVNRDLDREGQDVVIETRIVGPEVNLDLANKPLHPPDTSFGVAPEVEGSIRREDVRRSRMSRTLMDTERKRNSTLRYFGPILTPSLCHTLSHISGPPKVCHTSRTPQFLVAHACIHVFTGCLCKFAGFFVQGLSGVFCLERFVRGGFCPSPLLSEYIHYNRKLNITFNFSFHMYEFFLKCDVTCSWTPPPVTNCHTFSDPLPPSSVTYFMDGPLVAILGTGSGTQSCFPRGGTVLRMEQKSRSKFLPWPR